jgi:phosphoribosylpyrophosphate synthetase
VNIAAVHAILSPPALERIATLCMDGLLRRVMVTDTVCPDAMAETIPGLEVVSSTWLSARVINSIVTNAPMGDLLLKFDATAYLKSPALWHYAPAEARRLEEND